MKIRVGNVLINFSCVRIQRVFEIRNRDLLKILILYEGRIRGVCLITFDWMRSKDSLIFLFTMFKKQVNTSYNDQWCS